MPLAQVKEKKKTQQTELHVFIPISPGQKQSKLIEAYVFALNQIIFVQLPKVERQGD